MKPKNAFSTLLTVLITAVVVGVLSGVITYTSVVSKKDLEIEDLKEQLSQVKEGMTMKSEGLSLTDNLKNEEVKNREETFKKTVAGYIYYSQYSVPDAGDIWRINTDGDTPEKIIENSGTVDESQFDVFMKKNKIAYVDAKKGIVVTNTDGSEPEIILDYFYKDKYGYTDLQWSPDGDKLVFRMISAGDPPIKDGQYGIYTIEVKTKDLKRLTNQLNDINPLWFPDGSKIVFIRGNDIYSINATGEKNEVIYPVNEEQRTTYIKPKTLKWADANQIIFESEGVISGQPFINIQLINRDLKKTSYALSYLRYPEEAGFFSVSPNKEKVAFENIRINQKGGRTESNIFVIDTESINDKKLKQLTNDGKSFTPFFSPAGDKLAFKGVDGIYMVKTDGIDKKKLTTDEKSNTQFILDWK